MARKPISFTLNGNEVSIFVGESANLMEELRRNVGDLTPKHGCGQGTCGACTVMVDGEPQLSCITLAQSVEGRSIETVAGLSQGPVLHALQQAFIDGFAAQCGFCTPGMLMAAKVLLDRNPRPSRDEVIEAISGNICRCTGYEPIVDAILIASGQSREVRR